MYRISVCDDDKTELEKICGIVGEYTTGNGIPAQIRPFDAPAALLEFESENECADIYILDIIMPEMDGVRLGKEIRRRNADDFINVKSVNTAGFVMSDGTELTIARKYSDARKKYIDYELNGGAAL